MSNYSLADALQARELTSDCRELEKQARELESECRDLESECRELESECRELERQCSPLEDAKASLTAEIEQLKELLAAQDAANKQQTQNPQASLKHTQKH